MLVQRGLGLADLHLGGREARRLRAVLQPAREEGLAAAVVAAHGLEHPVARGGHREVFVGRALEAVEARRERLDAAARNGSVAQRGDDLTAAGEGQRGHPKISFSAARSRHTRRVAASYWITDVPSALSTSLIDATRPSMRDGEEVHADGEALDRERAALTVEGFDGGDEARIQASADLRKRLRRREEGGPRRGLRRRRRRGRQDRSQVRRELRKGRLRARGSLAYRSRSGGRCAGRGGGRVAPQAPPRRADERAHLQGRVHVFALEGCAHTLREGLRGQEDRGRHHLGERRTTLLTIAGRDAVGLRLPREEGDALDTRRSPRVRPSEHHLALVRCSTRMPGAPAHPARLVFATADGALHARAGRVPVIGDEQHGAVGERRALEQVAQRADRLAVVVDHQRHHALRASDELQRVRRHVARGCVQVALHEQRRLHVERAQCLVVLQTKRVARGVEGFAGTQELPREERRARHVGDRRQGREHRGNAAVFAPGHTPSQRRVLRGFQRFEELDGAVPGHPVEHQHEQTALRVFLQEARGEGVERHLHGDHPVCRAAEFIPPHQLLRELHVVAVALRVGLRHHPLDGRAERVLGAPAGDASREVCEAALAHEVLRALGEHHDVALGRREGHVPRARRKPPDEPSGHARPLVDFPLAGVGLAHLVAAEHVEGRNHRAAGLVAGRPGRGFEGLGERELAALQCHAQVVAPLEHGSDRVVHGEEAVGQGEQLEETRRGVLALCGEEVREVGPGGEQPRLRPRAVGEGLRQLAEAGGEHAVDEVVRAEGVPRAVEHEGERARDAALAVEPEPQRPRRDGADRVTEPRFEFALKIRVLREERREACRGGLPREPQEERDLALVLLAEDLAGDEPRAPRQVEGDESPRRNRPRNCGSCRMASARGRHCSTSLAICACENDARRRRARAIV
jgi:hypothetical protein